MGGLGLEALLPALVHRIPSGFLPTENKTQSMQRTDRSVSLSWGCPLSRWWAGSRPGRLPGVPDRTNATVLQSRGQVTP